MSSLTLGLVALAPGAAWALVGTVFNQGSTLVSNMSIAHLLGRSVFGEFVIVLATVQATASLANLGVGYTATRYLAEWRHRDLNYAGQLLGLFSRLSWYAAVGAAVVLAAGSTGIAGAALHAPALGPALLVAALSTVFTTRSGFLAGALTGLEAFRLLGMSGILSGVAYLLFTVIGARTGGVRGAAVGMLVSAALQCGLLTAALNHERRAQALPKGSASFRVERSMLLRFAVPAALSGFSTVPVLWAVQAFLARSPNGFGDLAIYGAGLNLLAMVLFTPTVLNGVAMAWVNRTRALQGDEASRNAVRTNVVITLLTVTCALVAMALLGPALLGLYGKDFRTGTAALVVLLAAAIPEALTNALNQNLQVRERMWESFLGINIPRDVVIIAAAFVLIPRFGATGAASAYLAGRVIALCAMVFLVRGDLSVRHPTITRAVPVAVE